MDYTVLVVALAAIAYFYLKDFNNKTLPRRSRLLKSWKKKLSTNIKKSKILSLLPTFYLPQSF
ncbi:hypothetical protein HNR48_004151 [Pseudoteredinibacter isoporae]|uniref:Uncharacterized protein n=1 Tax=Pseudoteredinibacter isoporae TaxID=570281 RepID=A0A7X0JYX0_9GAMM|nr:hypothetical protein [Pseudoteredinibacter isoporae]